MNKSALEDYWEALSRLKKGKPINVELGGRITNDQVSIEADRVRGSIKKSRKMFSELISAIEAAEIERQQSGNKDNEKYQRRRTEAKKYKLLYQESVSREISLAKENSELKKEIKDLINEIKKLK